MDNEAPKEICSKALDIGNAERLHRSREMPHTRPVHRREDTMNNTQEPTQSIELLSLKAG